MDTPYELSPEEEALYDMSDEELRQAIEQEKNEITEEEVTEQPEEVLEEEIVDEPTEEIDEEADGDTEQPVEDEEDSDENTEEGTEEDETEETEEPAELDEEEADKSEESEEKPAEEPEISKYKVKANGSDFEFTVDELVQLAPKAMDYTRKMQEIKPWRTTISALKDNGITHDNVNMMIDAFKGDKDAITELVKQAGLDTLDIDTENVNYSPKEYGRSEIELEIDEVVSTISKDPEYKITQHVVDAQWDDVSRSKLAENPQMISGLHADIKSGLYDSVSPLMTKLKALDGGRKSDIEYYIEAGGQYLAEQKAKEEASRQNEEAEKEATNKLLKEREAVDNAKKLEESRKAKQKAAPKRKAAKPTQKSAGRSTVIDYLEDDDEAYNEWYNKLQASQ